MTLDTHAYITHACTLAQTAPPLLSKPRDKSNGVFSKTALTAYKFIHVPSRYLTEKYFLSLESAESITMEATNLWE